MADQPLLPEPLQMPASNGKPNLPARPSYVEIPPAAWNDSGSQLLEYWHMFRDHQGTVLLFAFLGLLGGLLLTLPQTPVYQARTTIEIENLNKDFLHMQELSPTTEGGQNSQSDLQTQVSILQGEGVLRPVIAKLHLSTRLVSQQDNSRTSAWRELLRLPAPKPVVPDGDVLPAVERSLKVTVQPNTRLVEILYDSTNPQLAADVANAISAEFIAQNLDSRWKTIKQTGEWLTRQMEDVRIKLQQSEEQLQEYARTAGLLLTQDKDNVGADAHIHELQEELSKAQADREIAQSRYQLASNASPDSLPAVIDDASLKDDHAKLADLRRQLSDLSSTLTQNHPSVKKVQAQISTAQAALGSDRIDVIRRLQSEFESAQRREQMASARYDAQARLLSQQAARTTQYDILKRGVDKNRELYDSMLQHAKEASVASALRASNVRVVAAAWPPSRPYKPSLRQNAVMGLFVGIFFGMGFVVIRARIDSSIQDPGEASLYLDVQELGVIPSAESGRIFSKYQNRTTEATDLEQAKQPRLVELMVSQKGPSSVAESFRSTVNSILFASENGIRPRIIAITSATPSEGKTTVAANLAQALAEIGRRVLLIDGDLRKPRLHEIFNVPNECGLSDLLEGAQPLDESPAVVATTCPNLHLLPAGSVPSNISNLLHSQRALEFLSRVRQEFDMVIIDTPPMLQISDARVLGRMADAVILVVRSSRTTKATMVAARQRLAKDGTQLLGTVLNGWDPRKTADTGYEYGYGYGPYYRHESRQGK